MLLAPEIADDTLGGRISLARDSRGLSIAEASAVTGVMAETWNNWENDRAEPRSDRLGMLAGVLQISITWLIHGQGKGPNQI
ncbi:hypothetical protein ASC75_20850 [Aminobacter sp. DSM 101952]|nr:hypothetical protein ASC75_20850 [Aminobacter sp. DSM 101952]